MSAKNKTGTVTKGANGYQVEITRTFSHPIQKVWEAITDPKKMSVWFTDVEMDPRPGGKMTIRFRDKDKTVSGAEVVKIDPPHYFAFSWEGELAEWKLSEVGKDRCKLVFTYSKVDESFVISVSAGWHSTLDYLEEVLDGRTDPHPFGAEQNTPEQVELQDVYAKEVLAKYPELEKYRPIVVEQTYKAPVQKVWEAITDKDKMKKWYFDLSDFKPEVGFEFEFPGQGHKGEQYIHHCRITEVVPLKKLAYSWTYKNYAGYSEVSFELFNEGEITRLKLTHRGLHTFPQNNPDFARSSFNGGWTELIGKLLKNFVEAQG